jgi:hypothetical protein
MAELTISLSRDGPSGRLSIRVAYRAGADAIPFEHEIQHRRLVAELFPGIEITDDKDAAVRVERERSQEPAIGCGGDCGPGPGLPGGDDFDIEIIDL